MHRKTAAAASDIIRRKPFPGNELGITGSAIDAWATLFDATFGTIHKFILPLKKKKPQSLTYPLSGVGWYNAPRFGRLKSFG